MIQLVATVLALAVLAFAARQAYRALVRRRRRRAQDLLGRPALEKV